MALRLTAGESHAERDPWLASRHTELIRDIAVTLDLEAGLRDATLPAQHTKLVADLGRVLDVDAGLATILPAPAPPAATPHPTSNTGPEPAGRDRAADPVDGILAWLTNLGDGHRLAIRNELWLDYFEACLVALACLHEIRSATDLALAPDPDPDPDRTHTARALALAFDRDRALDRELALAFDRALARARDLDLDLARDHARELALAFDRALALAHAHVLARDLARAHARELALAFDRALARARVLARALDHALDHARARDHALALACALDHVLVHAKDLANNLVTMDSGWATDFDRTRLEQVRNRLDAVRHDYVGADLRDVDLTGLDLRGIRWSGATRWPPSWEEALRAGSVQLGDGVYEFRPAGGTRHRPVAVYT
jgi:hypothetical protein